VTTGTADRLGVRAEAVSRSRAARLTRWLPIWAALASACAIASLVVVFELRIGPVVLVISQRYSRGVHLGDLLIGVPFGLVAVAAGLVAVLAHNRAHQPAPR
jgi:hypothetical protein